MPALTALISQLRDAVETHAWTEDDLLFPVLVAHEHPSVLATTVSRQDLKRLVDTLASEHIRIRQIISALEELTGGFKTPAGAPVEVDDLVHLMKELTESLIEELDLEDRCLLPRAERDRRRARLARHGDGEYATEPGERGDLPGSPRVSRR